MKFKIRLVETQWKLLSSAFSNIAQAVIIFSLAAFFVPEAVGLSKDFSRVVAIGYLLAGLTIMSIGVILVNKGRKK